MINFFKGMLMGTADVVPGISGGTLALITGIYERLINALKSLSPKIILSIINSFFKILSRKGRKQFFSEFKKNRRTIFMHTRFGNFYRSCNSN